MISAGEAPLWNPLRGAGQPLLANPNALVLHPTTALFLILPFAWAFKLSIIAPIFLAGAGAWLLLRDIGASRTGGLLGASVVAFSGYMVSLGNLINLLDCAAFMPLTLWLAGRALSRGFAPWGSLAALSLAAQLTSPEPAILLCTAAAFVGLHWSLAGDAGRRSLKARLGSVAGIGLLAAAISMVALLPATELLSHSERGAGFDREEALKWSLPPAALLEAVVPGLFGDPTSADAAAFWGGGVFDAGLPFILSLYLGPGAVMLAAWGFVAGMRRRGARRLEAVALVALAAGGVALALGRFLPLYPALLSMLPPLESVRYPVKYFLVTTWAVALLAARGYDAAREPPDGRQRPGRTRRAVLAGLALGAVFAGAGWLLARAAGVGSLPAGLEAGAAPAAIRFCLLRGGAALALTAGAIAAGRSRAASAVAIVVPLVDLIASSAMLNPVAPASFYSEPPALGRPIEQAGGSGRIWATPRPRGFAFRTPEGPAAGSLQSGFRWDRMTLRNATYFPYGYRFAFDRGNERLDVMPGAAIGKALAGAGQAHVRPDAMSRLLSLAAVDRVIAYGGLEAPGLSEAARLEGQSNVPVVVMKNDLALLRARLVYRAEVIPDTGAALRRLDDASFDPNLSVILEEPLPAAGPAAAAGRAQVVADAAARVVVRTSSDTPACLVLADTFYPGWKASVDGADAPIVRADAMFRAVAVPAGDHEVAFVYAPSSVRSGLMVTAAALLLAALLAVPRRR